MVRGEARPDPPRSAVDALGDGEVVPGVRVPPQLVGLEVPDRGEPCPPVVLEGADVADEPVVAVNEAATAAPGSEPLVVLLPGDLDESAADERGVALPG